ncbi:MAG: hypothetical protein ACMUEL_06650 [Flavobacteriales bacterium Tduv]
MAEYAYQKASSFVLSNAPIVFRMGKIAQLKKETQVVVIPSGSISIEEIENIFDESRALC